MSLFAMRFRSRENTARGYSPSAPPIGDASRFSPGSGRTQALAIFTLCLIARLATTIHHIEDADSLRFALAMIDFDVARLQPQFPGYPVFVFAARSLYALTGSYAAAFSALGGIGLFVLIHCALSLLRWRATEWRGIGLIALFFFNPMLWLLGNRYMSDLSGAALLFASFHFLSDAFQRDGQDSLNDRTRLLAGFFLAGLQAGWRLSYLPFLAVPLAVALLRSGDTLAPRTERLVAGTAGVVVWLIPFIAVTGWNNLLAAARPQTAAHFAATGGTYATEPDWWLRIVRPLGHLWTDGLGAWWPDRHPVTFVVALGAATLLVLGGARLVRESSDVRLRLLLVSSATYAVWILLFQNVVNQTRHVLPLVPPLLIVLALGLERILQYGRTDRMRGFAARPATIGLAIFLTAYAAIGTTLALQHMQPAAIAQARSELLARPVGDALLVGAPWVVKCLSAQGIHVDFLAVETPEELEALRKLDPVRPLVTVGNYTDYIQRSLLERRTFYHNPYVNRLGAKVEIFRYGPSTQDVP